MHKQRLHIILLLLLGSLSVLAHETPVDSLLAMFDARPSVSVANELFDFFNDEELTDDHIQFSPETPADTLRREVWYWAAEHYNMSQQYELAARYGKRALPLTQATGSPTQEGDCLTVIAISLCRLGDFKEAVGYAKRCNEIDMELGDADNISSSYNLLAAIFLGSYQHEEAEHCILEGLKYCQQANNTSRHAILLGMACEVFYHQKKYEEALSYGRQALETEKRLGRYDKVAVRQAQMAEALIGMNRTEEARELLEQAIPVLRNGNRHSLGIAYNQLGVVLLREDRQAEAAKYFNQALQIFTEQKDLFNEMHSRKGLYGALRKSNPTLAMEHNDRYNELNDSIYDLRTSALVSHYAALVGNQRLQAENEEMKRIHQRNIFVFVIVFILLAVMVWAISGHLIRRQKRRVVELTRQIEEIKHMQQQQTEENMSDADDTDDRQFLINVINTVNDLLPTGLAGVEQVAEKMNTSTATFRRRLQSITGEQPKSYITAIQMQKAVQLLKDHTISVNDVALQCGFKEVSSFTRAFKRVYDLTPKQFVRR